MQWGAEPVVVGMGDDEFLDDEDIFAAPDSWLSNAGLVDGDDDDIDDDLDDDIDEDCPDDDLDDDADFDADFDDDDDDLDVLDDED